MENSAGERGLEPSCVSAWDPESGASAGSIPLAQGQRRKKHFRVRAVDFTMGVKVSQNFIAPAVKPLIRYFWAMNTKMMPGSAAISAPAHI